MIEQAAIAAGRHLTVRGVGRLLRMLYPCRPDSPRWVEGVRRRGDDLQVEIDSREEIDWAQLFLGGYEPHMTHLFEKLLPAGGVAVDVGANVGAHTLTLATLVGTQGRVLAFEPNPATRRKLQVNLSLNALSQVDVFGVALGNTNEQLQLRVPRSDSLQASNPGLASLHALETPHDLVNVDVRVFDEVVGLKLERLDVVKIDVQGYEQAVLEGMKSSLRRFCPAILFEYEDWAWEKSGSHWLRVYEDLSVCGYELWWIRSGRRTATFVPISDATPVAGHFEVLALPRGSGLAAIGRTS